MELAQIVVDIAEGRILGCIIMRLQLTEKFVPPTKWGLVYGILEPLHPKHNEWDYEAWTSSRDELQGIFGPKSNWPPYEFSLELNLKDLERHYEEFLAKEAFAYTILDAEKSSVIGCLYIRPSENSCFEIRVDFWFRNSHKQFEEAFFSDLKAWLKSVWKFENPAFPGRTVSWEEYYS